MEVIQFSCYVPLTDNVITRMEIKLKCKNLGMSLLYQCVLLDVKAKCSALAVQLRFPKAPHEISQLEET